MQLLNRLIDHWNNLEDWEKIVIVPASILLGVVLYCKLF